MKNKIFEKFKTNTFSKRIILSKYGTEDEQHPEEIFRRTAEAYSKDNNHCERMYQYMLSSWFIPSSPALYSAKKEKRGLPISCFINEVDDCFEAIRENWSDIANILHNGGGVGTLWSKVRSAGEKVGIRGTTSGVIPLLKVLESITVAVNSTSRRGNVAVYLDADHPEINEFINMRNPFGGDPSRKCHHIHHGVILGDNFINAVESNKNFELISRRTDSTLGSVNARKIMENLLMNRQATGEPYLMFKDRIIESTPYHHKKLNLYPKVSNLCTEITLPTGIDHRGKMRTAVCCLGSVNLEFYDEFKHDNQFIEDCMLFLDGMLQTFINKASNIGILASAVYSAISERSVGLGAMGLHSYAQKNFLALDGEEFKKINKKIFTYIREKADQASKKFALKYGSCLDAEEVGVQERFTYKTSIAPNANISLAFNTSPGIEPYSSNAYVMAGSYGTKINKNKNLDALIKARFEEEDHERIWDKIIKKNGSIADLSDFSESEKSVFKTAFEIDQNVLIDLAADRPICQAQSINLYFKHDENKKYIADVHMNAAKKVKTLYYYKTSSGVNSNFSSVADKIGETCESCSS